MNAKIGAEFKQTQGEQYMDRIELKNQKQETRHILELKFQWKWNGKKMSERKAYVDEAWEEDHATWNGEFAPR